MKISVVIPTYKRPELLINCLTALSKQLLDHRYFEVIVVSDGPDSVSLDLVEQWQSHANLNLTFLQTPCRRGPAAARNLGWQQAKAELIAFTDDDCIPDPCWLQAFVDIYHFEEYIAFTGKTMVPITGKRTDFANNTAHLQQAEFITANCAITWKTLMEQGGFDERFSMAWREDSDLHFRLLNDKVKIIRNEQAVVVHPVRDAPWGISIREQKKGIYDALLYKKYPQLFREKIQRHPAWNYYINIFLWLLLFAGILAKSFALILLAPVLLMVNIGLFFKQRIANTSLSASHLTDMAFTSVFIPFLSVFWRFYGCVKFRVFYL